MALCGCFGKNKKNKGKEIPRKDEVDNKANDEKPRETKPPANGTVAAVESPVIKQESTQQQQSAAPPPPQQPPPPPPVTKKVDLEAARKEFFEDMYSPISNNQERHVCFGKHEPLDCDLPFCYKKIEEQKQVVERLEEREQLEGLTPQEQQEVARMTAELKQLLEKLEVVATRIEAAAPQAVANVVASRSGSSPSATAYSDLVMGPVQKFCELSKKLEGDIATLAVLVNQAFQAQKVFIEMACRSKQPSQQQFMEILKPQSDLISKIQEFRQQNRRSVQFNHLSAISESIPALGWVTVAPAPGPYVKEMNDAGQFYTNRVLKEWKEKDKSHVEWVRGWIECLNELQTYIKQYHTTGLVWNPSGGEASLPAGGVSSSAGGAPPPPPPGPPPPPPPMMPPPPAAGPDPNDRSALFAEINQGSDITKGLKKVTSDMQTHKNPSLRAGPAPFKASGPKPYQAPTQATAATTVKPPVMTLDGKKWLVEYQKDAPNLIISETSMNQSVYVYRCEKSTIQVKGKVNSIILDSCKKTAVVFDSVVASVEFVNCQSTQMQVMGMVPTISIDKCDGVQMFLSDDSLGVEIVSSKSSEMNVVIPTPGGDVTEIPVPEQYKTTVEGARLKTVCTESI